MKKLGKFEFMARLASDGGVSPPLTGLSLPPLEPFGYGQAARSLSSKLYGRPVSEVEDEIQRRRQMHSESKKRPTVGDEVWNDDEV